MSVIRRAPRGRPSIGFQLEVPAEVECLEGAVVTCRERGEDGRTVGELVARVFAAALIIDRDGILADKASEALAQETRAPAAPALEVMLPGATGFRAEAIQRAPLPYVHVFALAAPDSVDGGILVTIRSLRPDWPAAEQMLSSLRLLTRHGKLATSDEPGANDNATVLPVVVIKRP